MTKQDDWARALAAQRLVSVLKISRTKAIRALVEKKTNEINWGQTADAVILEQAGEGFPEPEEQEDEGGRRCTAGHLWDEECSECAE
jgi:hypothetical protein